MTKVKSKLKPQTSLHQRQSQADGALPSTAPQNYHVRVSHRAKHVSIRVSHLGEVEVVVPHGFDQSQIPQILENRQDWILKTTRRVKAERQSYSLESVGNLPEQIVLRSLSEDWSITYLNYPSSEVLVSTNNFNHLTVSGQTDHLELCRQGLQRWLRVKAQTHLTSWLRQVSQEVKLPCGNISVRGQKTLWASCSNKKNISLNYKLLFLPPHLVQYVFIHELCHTIHLNHSAKFWELVAEKEPNYKALDKEVGKAWCYVPEWVERSLLS
jgi:hypothetical protein